MIEGKIESDRLPFNEQRNWKLKEFHLWHCKRIGDYNFQIIPFPFLKEKKFQFEMSQRKCGKNVLNSQCRNVTVNVSITYWTRHNNSRPFNRSIIHSPFRIDSSGNFFSSVQMNWWSKNIQNESAESFRLNHLPVLFEKLRFWPMPMHFSSLLQLAIHRSKLDLLYKLLQTKAPVAYTRYFAHWTQYHMFLLIDDAHTLKYTSKKYRLWERWG